MAKCILITIDSLRFDDATSSNLPETFSKLDEDFTAFTSACSHGVATPFAFPGLIAGTHPIENGLIPDDAARISEFYSGTSVAFSNNGHLSEKRGYAKGFDHYHTQLPAKDKKGTLVERVKSLRLIQNSNIARQLYNSYTQFFSSNSQLPVPYAPAADVTDYIQDAIQTHTPNLVWGHYMDPHTPYHPRFGDYDLPSSVSMSDLVELDERIVSASHGSDDFRDDELELVRGLYRSNIRYLDSHLARLLAWMESQHWYDDSFIAITSDHGEMFGEKGLLFHQWNVDPYDVLTHVPLWVKSPTVKSGTEDKLVGHGDLAKSIASFGDRNGSEGYSWHTRLESENLTQGVISVSNNSKRLTEPNGARIIRRDGTETKSGEVSECGLERLKSVNFPEILTSTGVALGVDNGDEYLNGRSTEDDELNEQLRALGYR